MQDNNKIKSILEKLRKLMDLKVSATQCGEIGEANAAAAGITRLLKDYNLTLQDIPADAKELDPVDMETVPYHFPYMQHRWYWALLDVVAKYNNSTIIRTRTLNGLKKVVDTEFCVIGRKLNREVVLYLVSFLGNQFTRIGKNNYPKWKMDYIMQFGCTPPVIGVYMKSFLLGCVIGLDEKLKKEQDSIPSDKFNALVKINNAEIDEFIRAMDVKNARQRKVNAIETAVADGTEVGRNIQIHKGVAGNRKKTLMLE